MNQSETATTGKKALAVAEKLAAKGCGHVSVTEPSGTEPGKVQINDDIHVEVPAEGDILHVVLKLADGSFDYGRPRKRIGYVELDISCAIHQGNPRP